MGKENPACRSAGFSSGTGTGGSGEGANVPVTNPTRLHDARFALERCRERRAPALFQNVVPPRSERRAFDHYFPLRPIHRGRESPFLGFLFKPASSLFLGVPSRPP